jgi:hypothetical protein
MVHLAIQQRQPCESAYAFGLDDNDIKNEGMAYAFNRNLEVMFKIFKNPVTTLHQRGACNTNAMTLCGRVAKALPGREKDSKGGVVHWWLDCLISAAERTWAKILKKRVGRGSSTAQVPEPLEEQLGICKRCCRCERGLSAGGQKLSQLNLPETNGIAERAGRKRAEE